jgi:hypothetical protein
VTTFTLSPPFWKDRHESFDQSLDENLDGDLDHGIVSPIVLDDVCPEETSHHADIVDWQGRSSGQAPGSSTDVSRA